MISRIPKYRLPIGKLVAALAVVALVFASGAAQAAPHNDYDWRYHEQHARHWHRVHREAVPGVVYAPPLVVQPPPPLVYRPEPVYAEPASPSLNFIIPLHIH